jgi:hypothetical protein
VCNDQFKDAMKDDDHYNIPPEERVRAAKFMAMTTHLDQLFLMLDTNVERRSAHELDIRRRAISDQMTASVERAVLEATPYKLAKAAAEAKHLDEESENPVEDLVDATKPQSAVHMRELHAALDEARAGSAVDVDMLASTLARMMDMLERVASQAQHGLWLSSSLSQGLEGLGSLNGGMGETKAANLVPDWVASLSSLAQNTPDSEIKLGPHFMKDTEEQKRMRKAQKEMRAKFAPVWQKYGSFSRLPVDHKVDAVNEYAERLGWSWAQTAKRLTDHIGYKKHQLKKQGKARELNKRTAGYDSPDPATKKRKRAPVEVDNAAEVDDDDDVDVDCTPVDSDNGGGEEPVDREQETKGNTKQSRKPLPIPATLCSHHVHIMFTSCTN